MRRKAYFMACQAYYIIFTFFFQQSLSTSPSPPRICFLFLLSFPKYNLPFSSLFINNSQLVHLRQHTPSDPWTKITSKLTRSLPLPLYTFSWTSVYTNQKLNSSRGTREFHSEAQVVCCFEFGYFYLYCWLLVHIKLKVLCIYEFIW